MRKLVILKTVRRYTTSISDYQKAFHNDVIKEIAHQNFKNLIRSCRPTNISATDKLIIKQFIKDHGDLIDKSQDEILKTVNNYRVPIPSNFVKSAHFKISDDSLVPRKPGMLLYYLHAEDNKKGWIMTMVLVAGVLLICSS